MTQHEADQLRKIVDELAAEFGIDDAIITRLPRSVFIPLSALSCALSKARASYLQAGAGLYEAMIALGEACAESAATPPTDDTQGARIATVVGERAMLTVFRKTAPYLQDIEMLEALLTEAYIRVDRDPPKRKHSGLAS